MNKDLRVAIIGAGAAGLTAAEELKEKGYKHVTIFEREPVAGGKCCSVQYRDRFYELGAGIITSSYHTIVKLAQKHQVELKPVDYFSRKTIDWDDVHHRHIPKNTILDKVLQLHQVLVRYRKLIFRHRKIVEPGLADIDKELAMPFSQWVARHKIPHAAEIFSYFFTAFGYGYYDEVPAAYVLKYYSWPMVKSFLTKKVYYLPNGIQNLWTTVAKVHDVIYNASITSIERGESVKISFHHDGKQKQLTFDKLIIASPLDESLKYLDASAGERSLFSKILYYDYRTYALVLKGFPNNGGFLPKNFTGARKGYPIFWHQQYPNSDFFAFYIIGDWKISDDECLKNIESTVHKLGGTIEAVQEIRHWKYFPHVTPEEMENGYFNQLEALQGQNNTYYAGEVMNFSTVELTAEYAKKLVERFFDGRTVQ